MARERVIMCPHPFHATSSTNTNRTSFAGVATICRADATVPVAAEEGFTGLLPGLLADKGVRCLVNIGHPCVNPRVCFADLRILRRQPICSAPLSFAHNMRNETITFVIRPAGVTWPRPGVSLGGLHLGAAGGARGGGPRRGDGPRRVCAHQRVRAQRVARRGRGCGGAGGGAGGVQDRVFQGGAPRCGVALRSWVPRPLESCACVFESNTPASRRSLAAGPPGPGSRVPRLAAAQLNLVVTAPARAAGAGGPHARAAGGRPQRAAAG